MTVYGKLAQARKMLQESGLRKTGNGYGFNYFELADFLPTTTEIFAQLGLASFTTITTESAKMTIVSAEDGSNVVFEIPFANFKSDDKRALQEVQELGGSITYMTRYLWVQVMNIVEPDSVDGKRSKPLTRDSFAKPQPQPTQPRQVSQPAPVANDTRPEVGETRVDENGHQWVVKRQRAKDHRFWVNTVTNETSDIG
jgi:hypothetical protein